MYELPVVSILNNALVSLYQFSGKFSGYQLTCVKILYMRAKMKNDLSKKFKWISLLFSTGQKWKALTTGWTSILTHGWVPGVSCLPFLTQLTFSALHGKQNSVGVYDRHLSIERVPLTPSHEPSALHKLTPCLSDCSSSVFHSVFQCKDLSSLLCIHFLELKFVRCDFWDQLDWTTLWTVGPKSLETSVGNVVFLWC